jgi:hypothetical protein
MFGNGIGAGSYRRSISNYIKRDKYPVESSTDRLHKTATLNLKDPVKQIHSFYYLTTSTSTNQRSGAGLLNIACGWGKSGKFLSEWAKHKFNIEN